MRYYRKGEKKGPSLMTNEFCSSSCNSPKGAFVHYTQLIVIACLVRLV